MSVHCCVCFVCVALLCGLFCVIMCVVSTKSSRTAGCKFQAHPLQEAARMTSSRPGRTSTGPTSEQPRQLPDQPTNQPTNLPTSQPSSQRTNPPTDLVGWLVDCQGCSFVGRLLVRPGRELVIYGLSKINNKPLGPSSVMDGPGTCNPRAVSFSWKQTHVITQHKPRNKATECGTDTEILIDVYICS